MKKREFYIYFIKKDNWVIKLPECLEDKIHEFQPHHYDSKVSDYEDLCQICGLPRVNTYGIYSAGAWEKYKSSERYNGLFEESLKIKRKNGLVK